MKLFNASFFFVLLTLTTKTLASGSTPENISTSSVSLSENIGYSESEISVFFDFINQHIDEIRDIQIKKTLVGNWERLGSGISKLVLTHPDLDRFVFKFENCNGKHCSSKQEITNEFENLKIITEQISYRNLNQIKTPKEAYFKSSIGDFIIAEKLISFKKNEVEKIESAFSDPVSVEEAFDQFNRLVSQTYLCEVNPMPLDPLSAQNSGWSYGVIGYDLLNNPIYGPYINIYDFDCVGLNYDRHYEQSLTGQYLKFVAGLSAQDRLLVHTATSFTAGVALVWFFGPIAVELLNNFL